MTAAATLRLFVAITLPDAVRQSLAVTADALRQSAPAHALRFVRPEGIHLTLKFLGAVEEERVGGIADALRVVVASAAPFTLRTGTVGAFGGRSDMRVVWVGVGGEVTALAALAASVDAAMAPLGFAPERRPFAAHLTLARVRDDGTPADRARIADAIAELPAPAQTEIAVTQIALMRSTLARGGALYEALERFPLAAEGDR